MTKEFEFQTSDEREQALVAEYGVLILQVSLILKRHAQLADAQAVSFFESAFKQMCAAAREMLKQKAH